jgi:hypothetical protein
MAKEKQPEIMGRAVLFGDVNYTLDQEHSTFTKSFGENRICEILDVTEVKGGRVVTGKYVLPLADAVQYPSQEGMIYCYNMSLPYLTEASHLADVEVNQIMEKAFEFAGRTNNTNKPPVMMWVLVLLLGVLAIIGMFKH